jgi:hypothetical protein
MDKNKKVCVYRGDSFYGIPESAIDFMAFWQAKLDLIPEEFAGSATIKIDCDIKYDCIETDIKVSYERPETEEETKARESAEDIKSNNENQFKLEQYNRLKKELDL